MNPITDICWSCVFPLTIGSASLVGDGQDDTGNPSNPSALQQSAPDRRIDRFLGTSAPGRCDPHTLLHGPPWGIAIDPGPDVPRRRGKGAPRQPDAQQLLPRPTGTPTRFFTGSKCCSTFRCLGGRLDLVYLTEVDPLWADDELDRDPQSTWPCSANAPAKAACAADCGGTADSPIASCSGARDARASIYPP